MRRNYTKITPVYKAGTRYLRYNLLMDEVKTNLKQKEQHLIEKEKAIAQRLGARRQAVFERFPLVFTLLGAFGLVATFYGFEGIINQIEFLVDNPFILLGTGLLTLILTGTLYKKLQ